MLGNKLQQVILFIIKNHQAADNIRLVVELIDLNKNKDQFVILSLGAEKVFDKIYKQYMFAVLN